MTETDSIFSYMQINASIIFVVICCLNFCACKSESLRIVSVDEFSNFVDATDYKTDAEKFGWSIVQDDVFQFKIEENKNWRNAYAENIVLDNLPVIQVSYNDAKAYADWSGLEIPDYDSYWNLVKTENGVINKNSNSILPIDQCHIIGNVWEIMAPKSNGQIRLAGGSYFCNENNCNGTSPLRELYIDSITANSHIGFAVIELK